MKNTDEWVPTKFIIKRGRLIANRNKRQVSISSRLMADIIASFYQEYLPKYCTGKLIDLGCGEVPLFSFYKNHVDSNICVDWSGSLHKNKFLDFECDLNEKLPFESEIFDTILVSDVLEHIYQPQVLWKEMSRILKINGYLIMNFPFFYWIHEAPFDYYRYTDYAIKKFTEDSGFDLIECIPMGGLPEILGDIHCKFLGNVPKIGGMLSEVIRIKTRIFLMTKIGNRISKSTSLLFPIGYFVVAQKKPR